MKTFMIISGLGLVFFILTMLAFVDVMRREFGTKKIKAVWSVVSLIPFVGWIVYFMLGARTGKVVGFGA